ncbi:MAG: GNAT family N-acetyltransferase [Betaproteobacteria bacterium]|nr:GNAT family N-acetyltransferase [Betaproteobacteria bacterium]
MSAPDNIEIRPVRLADVESFHTYLEVITHERRYWSKIEPKTLPELLQWFTKALKQGAPFLIACDGEEVIGHADLTIPTLEGHTHLGVLNMSLLPPYRGRGIGSHLLKAIVAAAWAHGLTRIELQAYSSNTLAIGVYERAGFRHEGRRRKARFLDGEYDDAVLMALLRDNT